MNKIPGDHIPKLAAIAKETVTLENVTGQIVEIISHVNCKEFEIRGVTLSEFETTKLLEALGTRVEKLILGTHVYLDLPTLTQYNGRKKCKMLELWVGDSHDRYMNEAEIWAKMVGWSSETASGFLGPKLRFFRP